MTTNVLDYKLCYVKDGCAWFTSVPMDEQWGDDWNDSPYEHNASEPYDDTRQPDGTYVNHDLVRIMFRGDLADPQYRHGHNSPYSVDDINKGKTPWLVSPFDRDDPGVFGGATMKEFLDYVEKKDVELFMTKELWSVLFGAK